MSIANRLQIFNARSSKQYPHKLIIELNDGDFVQPLVEFFQAVRKRANGGHSFSLEADREDNGGDGVIKCSIDGDGSDHFGDIWLDDKKIKD